MPEASLACADGLRSVGGTSKAEGKEGKGGKEDVGDVAAEMTPFRPGRVFKEEVETGLPYWLRRLPSSPFTDGEEEAEGGSIFGVWNGERQFSAVMLAEDALIAVSDVSACSISLWVGLVKFALM